MFFVVVQRILHKKVNFKVHLAFLIAALLLLLIYWVFTRKCEFNSRPHKTKGVHLKKVPHKRVKKHKICYDVSQPSLKNVLDEKPDENSIYFIDTSCDSHKKGRIALTKRHACAVEAISRLNLKKRVHVIYASPGTLKKDVLLTALTGYKNVGFFRANVSDFFKGTPAEAIYRAVRKFERSENYTRELLKLTTLWRFGGVLADFDFLFTKGLDRLADNFLVAKSGRIDDVVMRFDSGENAKRFLNGTFVEFAEIYGDGSVNHTTGEVVTKTLRKLCESSSMLEIIAKYCVGIKVYPSSYFMPYRKENWRRYFDSNRQKVMQTIARSRSVRLWEEHSRSTRVYFNSTSAYMFLAKKYCPQTVRFSRRFL